MVGKSNLPSVKAVDKPQCGSSCARRLGTQSGSLERWKAPKAEPAATMTTMRHNDKPDEIRRTSIGKLQRQTCQARRAPLDGRRFACRPPTRAAALICVCRLSRTGCQTSEATGAPHSVHPIELPPDVRRASPSGGGSPGDAHTISNSERVHSRQLAITSSQAAIGV